MADILFPAFEHRFKAQKRIVYATFLTDVVRSSSDAIDALSLFRNLLYGDQKGPESIGYMAFDPHGGETGCHIRAGMVLEVFRVHRQLAYDINNKPLAPKWIDQTIESLQETREKAKDLCWKLTVKKITAPKLGLSVNEETPARMLDFVGWKEPVFDASSGSLYESPIEPSGSASSTTLTQALANLNVEQGIPRVLDQDATSSSATAPQTPSSTVTSFDDVLSPVQTNWNLHDGNIMLRFVIYSYILSKYKMFFCLKSNVGARLFPEAAVKYQYELMTGYWNYDNVEFRKAKLDRNGAELRALQSWMSDLSCAWLQSCAARHPLSNPMTRLVTRTVQKSSKSLSAIACYPAYLLLRNELGKHQETYIIIDRHFCSHGIHYNVFLADLKNSTECTLENPVHACDWTLRKASIPELYNEPEQWQPHPVVVGNSINGPVTDYMARLASHYTPDPNATSVHDDDNCEDNIAHVAAFLQSDQDQVAQSFFGSHVSYSFPLVDGQEENNFVSARIKEELPGLQEPWDRAKSNIANLGAGHESLEVFGWQHMFVETKERLACKLEEWIRRKDLMPLSADVGVC